MYFETPYMYSSRIIISHIVLYIFKPRIYEEVVLLADTLSYVFWNPIEV